LNQPHRAPDTPKPDIGAGQRAIPAAESLARVAARGPAAGRRGMTMNLQRISFALALCAAAATAMPARADEQAERLATAFAKTCLAKPDSMTALNKLAVAQGFALDQRGADALAEAENKRTDPFSLLLFWTSGTDKSRVKLTGLMDGKAERYELGCVVDATDVPPQDVLAALKPVLGEPSGRTIKEGNWIELAWTASGDARLGAVTLTYKEGPVGPRVALTLVQMLGTAAAK